MCKFCNSLNSVTTCLVDVLDKTSSASNILPIFCVNFALLCCLNHESKSVTDSGGAGVFWWGLNRDVGLSH